MSTALAASRLVADARAGLWQDPPTLPARWFYDERGSRLFDEITRLPEYYPSRRETEILQRHSGEIVERSGATALLELGSGLSTKTRLLLSALTGAGERAPGKADAHGSPASSLTAGGRAALFIPLDVSEEVMAEAADEIAREYPSLSVRPLAADFTEPFGALPGEPGRRLVAVLGGTIGNFEPAERAGFLARIRAALAPGDHFLLSADLLKAPSRLISAYDDSAGVTAAFNRNLIEVLRRELDATGLYVDDFEHVARWNPHEHRVEMWLRARRDVHAHLAALERDWTLPAGAEIRTEVSTKFRVSALRDELEAAGLAAVRTWTDAAGDYSVTLTVVR